MSFQDPTQSKIPRLGDGIGGTTATTGSSGGGVLTRIPRGIKAPSVSLKINHQKSNHLGFRFRSTQTIGGGGGKSLVCSEKLNENRIKSLENLTSNTINGIEKCRMDVNPNIVMMSEIMDQKIVDVDGCGGNMDDGYDKEKSLVDEVINEKDNTLSNVTDLISFTSPGDVGTLLENEEMDIDDHLEDHSCPKSPVSANYESLKKHVNPNKPRFSFGLDLTDCSLDCSIELCDNSGTSSTGAGQQPLKPPSSLKKENSFEVDESLGILTPDQMKEFLDSAPSTTNLDLPLECNAHSRHDHKINNHQCRIDQTPSPEELPLDPVSVKTDISEIMSIDCLPSANILYQELSQTDSDSKMDVLTKSSVSKASNSFITSITSVTSLDTGYQGDGEMSRPASRGADHSPATLSRVLAINQQKLQNNNNTINWNMNAHPPIARRQDPMTDSDFFTESDADDVVNRGDRRAQVIDGQLYGPSLQAANVFIDEENMQEEESCMESSGIFTDVENRPDNDMSPDTSTETIRSNSSAYSQCKIDSSPSPTSQIHNNFPSSQTYTNLKKDKSDNNLITTTTQISDMNHSVINDVNIPYSTSKTNINDSTTTLLTKDKRNSSSSSVGSSITTTSVTNTKKLSPSRKQNKNEANANLKKHEMSKRTSSTKLNSVSGTSGSNSVNISNSQSRKNSSGADDNQENKRPTSINIGIATMASRKIINTTNKWDAVMSKIEQNKSSKMNFSSVKSKVSCGIVSSLSAGSSKRASPGLVKSASTTVNVGATNRNMLCNSKR